MRLFDETNGIKHSVRLMQPKTFLISALVGAAAFGALAQNGGTNTPPLVPPNAIPFGSTNAPSFQTNAPPPLIPLEASQERKLTMEECIRLALQHNLDIQIQQQNPIINQYLLNVGYGVYEPVGSFTGTKSYEDQPGGINSDNIPIPGSVRESDTYAPSITGVLPTGLSYDISGNLERDSLLTSNTPPHYLPPFYTSTAGIQLSQPLLKNFWIDENRLKIQLSKATLKISEQALRLQIMTTVTAVKTAYYNLLYARGNVNANYEAYKLAEQLVSENVKRVQVGTLAPLDEKQSESQAATSLATMRQAQQALVVQENTLKSLLTENYSEWEGVEPVPTEQLMAIPQELNLHESWRKAVTQRPELVEAKLKVEQQNITLKYDFNQRFPELDLQGSYGHNANQNSVDDNLTELRTGNHSYYSYGVGVTLPLGGNYSARAQYKSDKAALRQLLLTLKQTEQNIVITVDNDVANVRSTLQQVDATRDARIYAQAAVDAEQKKLENGKSTSFVVLQLISTLTTAKVNEIQALANYNIAVAQLAQDEGSTLDANHIDVKVR
jgi:outer membrane protein